jgi:hypothetical protein
VLLLTPEALIIVVLDLAGLEVAHDGVLPARKFDAQARSFGIEQLGGLGLWSWKLETGAGGFHGRLVTHLGLDFDDVGQIDFSYGSEVRIA